MASTDERLTDEAGAAQPFVKTVRLAIRVNGLQNGLLRFNSGRGLHHFNIWSGSEVRLPTESEDERNGAPLARCMSSNPNHQDLGQTRG